MASIPFPRSNLSMLKEPVCPFFQGSSEAYFLCYRILVPCCFSIFSALCLVLPDGASNATCFCRGAGLFFLAALHRWLSSMSLLSCLLTYAKYLLNYSAFVLSQTISFPSWIRGCGLVFFLLIFP